MRTGEWKEALRMRQWEDKDTDRFLDLVLTGAPPSRIATELDRTTSEIKSHFDPCFYNKHYRPSMPRIWRGDKKLTALEIRLIQKWKRRGWPVESMGQILQRKPDEISQDDEGRSKVCRMQYVAPVSDLILAYHYLFYQARCRVISDQAYDLAKKEEIEFGGAGELIAWLDGPEKKVTDYPPHIRSLAHYIQFKDMRAHNCVDYDQLPNYFAPVGYYGERSKRSERSSTSTTKNSHGNLRV